MPSERPTPEQALEMVRKRLRDSRFAVLLGFEPESIAEGKAVLAMRVDEHHRQMQEVVHGGALAALADTAAAIAAYTVVPQGVEIVTIELKINYLAPVPGGRVRAEGTVLRAGRNFIVTECEVRTEEGQLAAKALLTFGAAGGFSLRRS